MGWTRSTYIKIHRKFLTGRDLAMDTRILLKCFLRELGCDRIVFIWLKIRSGGGQLLNTIMNPRLVANCCFLNSCEEILYLHGQMNNFFGAFCWRRASSFWPSPVEGRWVRRWRPGAFSIVLDALSPPLNGIPRMRPETTELHRVYWLRPP